MTTPTPIPTPIHTVTIVFGGLCLFVKRGDPSLPPSQLGIYVLMPMTMPDMQHCPLIELPSRADGESPHPTIRSLHDDIKWGDLATTGDAGHLPTRNMLAISTYGENTVEDRWLDEHERTEDPLAVRIRLPLWCDIVVASQTPTGRLNTPGGGHCDAVGQITVSFTLSRPVNSLPIGKLNLVGDENGNLNLRLLNIPWSQYSGRQYRHSRGEPVKHVDAYFSLLKKPVNPDHRITVADDVNADCPEAPGYAACPTCVKNTGGPTVQFADPFNCSVGFGCPDGTENC
jgi:hypothetical protein